MFIVLMLPLDKSFHKVKCYSLTVTQASGTTASNVVRRGKNPRVQIHVAIKIYSFIHLFIQFISEIKQASKENKQAITGRPMGRPTADDRRRPTDRRRSTTTDRPPTIDDRPPTIDDRRPTDRPTTDHRWSTTHDRLLRRLLFVFLHFDGRLSMSDDRLSTVENSIVIFAHFGAPYIVSSLYGVGNS